MAPLEQDYLQFLLSMGFTPPTPRLGTLELASFFREQIARDKADRITGERAKLNLRALDFMKDTPDESLERLGVSGSHGVLDLYVNAFRLVLPHTEVHQFERIYFGEFPLVDFNAHAMRTDNGYLCLIHGGLRRLLHQISMIATLLLCDDSSEFHQANTPEMRQIIAANGAYAAYQCYIGSTNEPMFFPDLRTTFRDVTCSHLVASMKAFLVAHEIGHIVLGHLDGGSQLDQSDKPDDPSYRAEFDADDYAQNALFVLDENKNKTGITLSVAAGGVCFLLVSQIVDIVAAKAGFDVLESRTHPPDQSRIDALLGSLNRASIAPKDADVVSALIQTMNNLKVLIEPLDMTVNPDGVRWKIR
jgi:hypothetical protein